VVCGVWVRFRAFWAELLGISEPTLSIGWTFAPNKRLAGQTCPAFSMPNWKALLFLLFKLPSLHALARLRRLPS